ncbi:sialidase family protein [Azohydromonas caseinilytica]|uniref:Exo-alpha-sialidase n=1 Tax=Azohydromonas caseinilytica TaxID=2728836 RepID=A0A848FHW0_9BURK|nr:sialidase family protein [Azohydromonas caseinilytica]NML18894.1 exo-alpha-sialidase [Azohydromonas caseinilytica]
MLTPSFSYTPPEMTAEQKARLERYLARQKGHGPAEPSALPGLMQRPQRATNPPAPGSLAEPQGLELDEEAASAGAPPAVPGTFRILNNRALAPTFSSSDVNEPSHANAGRYVWYVGNWYAARSTNKGATWTYVNPAADFQDFCCDQDVIYDSGRNILLWYRQGIASSDGTNNIRLGVSRNGGASWIQYNITFSNYANLPAGWFDYPHLALSNNYLYITSNYFNPSNTFQRMILTRIPLDQLLAGGAIGWTWWSTTSGWAWTPVQGARNVMYVGDHLSNTSFRICSQPEANTALNCSSVAVPAWTWTPRGTASCIAPNGLNPCARLDHRINAGYLKEDESANRHELGFFWTVAQGAGFPFPYVNALAVDASTLAPLPGARARPLIWTTSAAWVYAGAAPNARGALGIATWLIGGGVYPQLYVGIDDDYNGFPPGWQVAFVAASNGVVGNRWGDYVRVRMHSPDGNTWSASGHVTVNGTQQPRYVNFGRERDMNGYLRFRLQ